MPDISLIQEVAYQLSSVANTLATTIGGSFTALGVYTAPTYTTALGTTAATVQAALTNETTAITTLGGSVATNQGGGATYSATTGLVSAPAYSIANIAVGGAVGAATTATDTTTGFAGLTASINNLGNAVAAVNTTGAKYFHATSAAADSVASGTDSIAAGPNAQATGIRATAVGSNALASLDNATAIGVSSAATAVLTTAIGSSSKASNTYATAVGYLSNASNIIRPLSVRKAPPAATYRLRSA